MRVSAPFDNLPIVFEGVGLADGGATILDHVNLTIAPGEPTVLIGPNGSGKTSLLRIAANLVSPASGRVTWGGREAPSGIPGGIVFQRPAMLRRTAGGNIRYTLTAARIARTQHGRRVTDLLNLVGLNQLRDRPARRLSTGEQQRLALARALASDPAVLFLDEPTASLDPNATQMFEEIVRAVASRGVKIVMSTHDLGEARRLAEQIVLLDRGRVIETGSVTSFFNTPQTPEARKFIAGELLV